jgi:tRNA (guanine10-N2)-dimethyltransferase
VRFYLFFSGEHSELPLAEAQAAFAAQGIPSVFTPVEPRLELVECDAPRAEVMRCLDRLALTHDAGPLIATTPYREEDLQGPWSSALPTGASVAARAERLASATPWRRTEAEGIVGAASGRRVDLKAPKEVLRVFLGAQNVYVGWRWLDRDPKAIAARQIRKRPHFSPVSLEPKWARVLLNLAQLAPGDLVIDPFCGSGGILLEAASMGFRVAGSDLSPEMIEGARTNLKHFGHTPEALFASDVQQAYEGYRAAGVGRGAAVVTDLPYGRSASTGREERHKLYRRASEAWRAFVRPGDRIVVGVPSQEDVPIVGRELEHVATYPVRVHRSLTRHFVVFRLPG